MAVVVCRESKMAELSAEAPLAPSEEWNEFSDFQQAAAEFHNGNDNGNTTGCSPPRNKALDNVKKMESSSNNMADHFGETSSSLSSSLEDLVNTFDDKITKCFRDLDQNVESLAPVQIRNQDDIINESQCVNKPNNQMCLIQIPITTTEKRIRERLMFISPFRDVCYFSSLEPCRVIDCPRRAHTHTQKTLCVVFLFLLPGNVRGVGSGPPRNACFVINLLLVLV